MQKIYVRSGQMEELASIPSARDELYPVQVVEPAMYVLLPDGKPFTGQMALMLPGGGYNLVALAQCFDTAKWLNAIGVACAVLEYRLPRGNPEKPVADITDAWLCIRQHAERWGVAMDKTGLMGFSAGGQLAANRSTLFAHDAALRPAFTILYYPVIDLLDPNWHEFAQRFLGQSPSREALEKYSAHLQVGQNTPPALVMLSDDDKVVPPAHGILYYNALHEQGVSASLHIFATGGHAWSLGDGAISGQLCSHAKPAMEVTADWLARL
jgi:acetyl esterase/lipase